MQQGNALESTSLLRLMNRVRRTSNMETHRPDDVCVQSILATRRTATSDWRERRNTAENAAEDYSGAEQSRRGLPNFRNHVLSPSSGISSILKTEAEESSKASQSFYHTKEQDRGWRSLSLKTCIQVVLSLNLGWDTGDPDENCSLFFSGHPENWQPIILFRTKTTLSRRHKIALLIEALC
jgi:hypothetical protein